MADVYAFVHSVDALILGTVEEIAMSKNQHVVPNGDSWSVRRAGSSRASGVFKSKPEAIVAARGIAKNQGTDLFIHGEDGRIQKHETHKRNTALQK